MKKLILLVSTVVLSLTATAQNASSTVGSVKTACDTCLSQVSSGKADDAFSILFSEYWKDKSTAAQAASSMQREYRNVLGRIENTMGKLVPAGYEFIGIKRLGTSVMKLVYLQKNELFFLPWAFSFYKAAEEWRLTFISFPDAGSDDLKDFVVTELAHAKP